MSLQVIQKVVFAVIGGTIVGFMFGFAGGDIVASMVDAQYVTVWVMLIAVIKISLAVLGYGSARDYWDGKVVLSMATAPFTVAFALAFYDVTQNNVAYAFVADYFAGGLIAFWLIGREGETDSS